MRGQTTHDTIASVPSPSVHQPPAAPTTETHSAAALRLVLQALAEQGCDLEAETAALGLSLDEVHDIEGRIPRSAYCALWQRLADITGDPDCGLHLACRLPTGALGIIEYVACNAPTLGEGYASIARYGPLLHDTGTHHFTADHDIARFCYRAPTSPPSPRALIDWAFAYMIAAGRRGVQVDFPLRRVHVQYPPPADTRSLIAFYRCPIEFAQPTNELWLDASVLRLPVRRADSQLAQLMTEFAERQIAKLAPHAPGDPFIARLHAAITPRLSSPSGPRLGEVARHLGVSIRTLQRRLRDHRTTFQATVSEVRLTLATSYLSERDLALSEIAFVLGFSEPSAFHRAFKRAFGCTPAEYRARQTQPPPRTGE